MKISGQIMRFGIVGGAATATHMAVAAALLSATVPWPVWLINVIAFAVAFWVSFFGHRHFTFKRKGSPVRFLGAAMAGLAVNNVFLLAVLWVTGNEMLSVVLAAAAAPVAVFAISRLWVFNEPA